MKSFSSLVKEEISSLTGKQRLCCCFSLLYGILFFFKKNADNKIAFSTNAENAIVFQDTCQFLNTKKKFEFSENARRISVTADVVKYSTIAEIEKNIFKCQHCRENFLKGIFLSRGSVSDPQKMYRMDISFDFEDHANQILNLLHSIGLNFKKTTRLNKHILYTKDSDCISDFLALIGANNSVYEVINSKIKKELRNEVNRVTNCDSANINKTVKASQKYCVVIEMLIKEGLFEELPDNLKEMAKMRLKYDSLNFADLGKKFNPQISKSGVYHRLEKIIAFYEKASNSIK